MATTFSSYCTRLVYLLSLMLNTISCWARRQDSSTTLVMRVRRNETLVVVHGSEDEPLFNDMLVLGIVVFMVLVAVGVLMYVCGVCSRPGIVEPFHQLIELEEEDRTPLDQPQPQDTKSNHAVPLAGPVPRQLTTANNNRPQLQLQRTRAAWMSNLEDQPSPPSEHPSEHPQPRELVIRTPTRPHVTDLSGTERRAQARGLTEDESTTDNDPWTGIQQSNMILPHQRETTFRQLRDRRHMSNEQQRLQRETSHYGFDDEFDDRLARAVDPFESGASDEDEYNGENFNEDGDIGSYMDIETASPNEIPPHFEEPYRHVSDVLQSFAEA
eukprot:TRINITY_DN24326_c0_g1_i1.p1 TRINITY_DN24326_c0_g1~~TRINITY_DN24326_c0_g1_i1.p1  ORF type:complete len:327 (+),score=54.09 TRINITY_DN24326_c0_g1_i1:121-1101(+)